MGLGVTVCRKVVDVMVQMTGPKPNKKYARNDIVVYKRKPYVVLTDLTSGDKFAYDNIHVIENNSNKEQKMALHDSILGMFRKEEKNPDAPKPAPGSRSEREAKIKDKAGLVINVFALLLALNTW